MLVGGTCIGPAVIINCGSPAEGKNIHQNLISPKMKGMLNGKKACL